MVRSASPYLGMYGGLIPGPWMDRLLTAQEVAQRLGMRTDWVWAQARADRIPHVRLGRYRRFRASAIEAWLQELESGSAAAPATARTNPIPPRRQAYIEDRPRASLVREFVSLSGRVPHARAGHLFQEFVPVCSPWALSARPQRDQKDATCRQFP
jgi:excisionase family DNA binding protein